MAKVRLFVDHPLSEGQPVLLKQDQAHYLFGVMRLSIGSEVLIFDGQSGEWQAKVTEAARKRGELLCQKKTKPLQTPPDLWLLFSPIKKTRTDFIVEKATELGVAHIQPVQTEFTNAERIRRDRLQTHAIEAAEQCGGTFVPDVSDLKRLEQVLAEWNPDRQLYFCDETAEGLPSLARFGQIKGPSAILIGPEGGFSEKERAHLQSSDFVTSVSLGPRILRADTAAVAALTLWQAVQGDWL